VIPFFVADVVVRNPCADIDPNSWAWIFSGCWIFTFFPVLLAIGLAVLMAVLLSSLRQEQAA
jgi:hypothetical protein